MTSSAPNDDLRVLIVDDTIVYRKILRDIVAEIPGAEVVATAINGRVALTKMEMMPIDFVLLDVEMPEMDGLQTMEEIARRWPEVGVLMLSGANRSAAELALAAVERGAIDFIPKPSGDSADTNRALLKSQLGAFLRSFSARKRLRFYRTPPREPRFGGEPDPAMARRPTGAQATGRQPLTGRASGLQAARATGLQPAAPRPSAIQKRPRPTADIPLVLPPALLAPMPRSPRPLRIEALAIGISTGGPQALNHFIPELPGDLGVPVFIVQHMPPMFTASLAQNLDRKSQLTVVEGADGMEVKPNVVYIAPGGRHMVLRQRPGESGPRPSFLIGLNDNPPENSCRPAADVLFRSVANAYRGNLLVTVMTGMGADGAMGVRAIKQHSAYCLTQSPDSCVIYGMPRAVDEAGLSDESVPLEDMAARIAQIVRHPRTMQ